MPASSGLVEQVADEAQPEVVDLSADAIDGVEVEDRLVQVVHHHVPAQAIAIQAMTIWAWYRLYITMYLHRP